MLIIGCDFHSRFQQIAMLDTARQHLCKGRGSPFLPQPGKTAELILGACARARWTERVGASEEPLTRCQSQRLRAPEADRASPTLTAVSVTASAVQLGIGYILLKGGKRLPLLRTRELILL